MSKDEIAANIVIAMLQKPEFKVLGTDPKSPQAFVSAVCDAYKQVYQTLLNPEVKD